LEKAEESGEKKKKEMIATGNEGPAIQPDAEMGTLTHPQAMNPTP
jgi:hypothetical protein